MAGCRPWGAGGSSLRSGRGFRGAEGIGARRLRARQLLVELEWRDDPVTAYEQDVRAHEQHDREGQQQDVPAVHLAEVGDVEEGPYAGRVERVLGLRGDPLRVVVL